MPDDKKDFVDLDSLKDPKREKLEQLLEVNFSVGRGRDGKPTYIIDELDDTGRGNFAIGNQMGKALEEIHNKDKGFWTRNFSPEKVDGFVMEMTGGRSVLASRIELPADNVDGVIALIEKDPGKFHAIIPDELHDRHKQTRQENAKINKAREALDRNADGTITIEEDINVRKQRGQLLPAGTFDINNDGRVADEELARIVGGKEHRGLIAAARSVISGGEEVRGTPTPGSSLPAMEPSVNKNRSNP